MLMKLFSANIEDLRTLYLTELRKALDMEQKITNSLPKLIENSSDPELAGALDNHLGQTQGHVIKLQQLLQTNAGTVSTETCKAIEGLSTAASDSLKDATAPAIRDIVIIEAAQSVEHHEIALYGTLRRWAALLGLSADAEVLESIEAEEFEADELLTRISESVNIQAAA
jgi:ferritin-like metal-binding protein YciE